MTALTFTTKTEERGRREIMRGKGEKAAGEGFFLLLLLIIITHKMYSCRITNILDGSHPKKIREKVQGEL